MVGHAAALTIDGYIIILQPGARANPIMQTTSRSLLFIMRLPCGHGESQ